MTWWPELVAILVARSSWPSALVALFLVGGLIGVVLMNQRSRRRFHERHARRETEQPPF